MEYSKIDELERLAAQATPGPWDYDATGVFKWRFLLEKRHVCECMTEANAAYIVAACNSLPTLIAELKEARAEKAVFKSWQTGTPPGPGFYWVKYKSGYVKVIELELRRAGLRGGVSWTYLGLANEYFQPFEDEEDIVAWAGPLPMPEKKEAGE